LIRTCLSDERYARISGELPGKVSDPGQTAKDNRLFVEAVLWIARTGSPWRDLPAEFGKWFSVYTRFWRWSQRGVWERVFKALSDDPDFEYVMIDGTICRVHQHGAGAKGGLKIRRSAVHAAD
jgi:putative transposase